METLYDILEVSKKASKEVIDKAMEYINGAYEMAIYTKSKNTKSTKNIII